MKVAGVLGVLGGVGLGLAGLVATIPEIIILAASLALFAGGVVAEARARAADQARFTVTTETPDAGTDGR